MNSRPALPVLYMVIPCYNEEDVLPITAPLFREKLESLARQQLIHPDSRILLVNDGSRDRTWEIIRDLSEKDLHFQGISQSRNRGHQNAVLAGLMESRKLCDVTISIDCDGQDDLNAMDEMLKAYHEGSDVVYGVRSSRKTDSLFKRMTAQSFYRFMRRMGAEVVYNHADYRLLSSRVLSAFADFHEVNLFLRGLVPLIGFRSTSVYYERRERLAGESHYPLKRMIGLAFDGITSLSVKPIRMITYTGLIISVISFIGIIWAVVTALMGSAVEGWASIACVVCFMGGIQSMFMGIIGEYIGKIYLETKGRPRYIISEHTSGMPDSPGTDPRP